MNKGEKYIFLKPQPGGNDGEDGENTLCEGLEVTRFTFSLGGGPRSHVGQCVYFERPFRSLRGQGAIRQSGLHHKFGPRRDAGHRGRLDVGAHRSHATRRRQPLRGQVPIR